MLPVGAEEFIVAAEPWPGAGAVLNWLCRTELPILPPSTTPGTALLHPAQGAGKSDPVSTRMGTEAEGWKLAGFVSLHSPSTRAGSEWRTYTEGAEGTGPPLEVTDQQPGATKLTTSPHVYGWLSPESPWQ